MNSLSAYRLSTAVLSIAVLVLGGTVWRISTGGGGHDGNPSGLDVINPKQTVTATLQGDIKTTMPCLTMGNKCAAISPPSFIFCKTRRPSARMT